MLQGYCVFLHLALNEIQCSVAFVHSFELGSPGKTVDGFGYQTDRFQPKMIGLKPVDGFGNQKDRFELKTIGFT